MIFACRSANAPAPRCNGLPRQMLVSARTTSRFFPSSRPGYEHVNAAKQRRDPNSMLNWTERIMRMRKEVPEVGWGDFKVIATRNPAVLVIRYDWRNNSVLFVHHLEEKPREISFRVGLPGEAGKLLVNLLSEDHS